MKIGLCQINPTVGAIADNRDRVGRVAEEARDAGADLAVFPEMCLTGYPPRDLLERPRFVAKNLEARDALASRDHKVALLFGFVDRNTDAIGKPLHNAAALCDGGRLVSVHHKRLLPTYDVFDEDRYFEPAREIAPVRFREETLGVTICEDIWNDPDFIPIRPIRPTRLYPDDPPVALVRAGARILVNIAASPFTLPKREFRARMISGVAQKHRVPLVFVNQVGGNDDLLFDGASVLVGADGRTLGRAREFGEDLLVADVTTGGPVRERLPDDVAAAYEALVMGLRDYARKCGFETAVLGVSGGIDSALCAAIATEALGARNVHAISLPSRYSSAGSLSDAALLANALGVRHRVVSIEPIYSTMLDTLVPSFGDRPADVTEENLQARIRGVVLMALSNKWGHLLLTTGNKSELAVGYCTLYGDMCGGLAVLSDVPKTMVYKLARHANRTRAVIPEASFTKPPSAELRANQTDQDTLPPYELLDRILEAYVERGEDLDTIASQGVSRDVARDVIRRIARSEYKRRQAAPGLILTSKAFGPGRRVPIAQKFEE